MPQLIVLLALGAAAYLGYRWLKQRMQAAAIEAAREEARRQQPKTTNERNRDAGELVYDEKEGVYKPKE